MGTKRLAYLNGIETTAHKTDSGLWLVGGDKISAGDNVQIAAREFKTGRLAWHVLKGNRLIFDDFLSDSEILKQDYISRHS